MIINTEAKWGPAIHRFGHQFDHALVSATWRWRTKKTEKTKRPDFKAMDAQRWADFDSDLRIRIEESKIERYAKPQPTGKVDKHDVCMEAEYEQLTSMVQQSINSTMLCRRKLE